MMGESLFLPSIRQDSKQVQKFATSWLLLLGGRRSLYRLDERLVSAAQKQAEWLSLNDFEENLPHLGENGSTANQRVREEGYRLPTSQGDGNTVESCANSQASPEEVAVLLSQHDSHRNHMLGLDWYANHIVYGVGAKDTYYVCLICPEEEDNG